MKFSFNFYGDFAKYTKEDLSFGAIEFDSNNKHYIIDLVGDVEYNFSKNEISSNFKGDVKVLSPKTPISDEELKEVFLNMDKTTFQYNILDGGDSPDYRKFESEIWFDNKVIEIGRHGTQPMKVYDFFDILRKYPDWNVDLLVANPNKKILDDIVDIVADERNGNLIIVKREN